MNQVQHRPTKQLMNRATRGIENDPALLRRGIAKAALKMHWGYSLINDLFYWSIPLPRGMRAFPPSHARRAVRLKAIPRDEQCPATLAKTKKLAKYMWHPTKPKDAIFYHHPTMQLSIQKSQGNTLNIVNGEPAVLAMIEAQIYNTLCFYSEQASPRDLADRLKLMGVRTVNYFPDADDAGYTAASRIKSLLEGSGIDLLIADLRMLVEPKGDVNDLWISCDFDRDKLIHELKHAPPLEIQAVTHDNIISAITEASSSDEADAVADVVHACLVRSRSRTPYKKQNYVTMRSPLREDDTAASFSIDTLTGVAYDHALGESYAAVTLARRFQLSERTIAITKLMRQKSLR